MSFKKSLQAMYQSSVWYFYQNEHSNDYLVFLKRENICFLEYYSVNVTMLICNDIRNKE